MLNQSDSSLSGIAHSTPNKILVTADVHNNLSVTDRVIARISKQPKPIIKTFLGNASCLSNINEDRIENLTYASFKSGEKVFSTAIEDSQTSFNLSRKPSREIVKTPNLAIVREEPPVRQLNPEDLKKIDKFLARKKPHKKVKKDTPIKRNYGTSLLSYIAEMKEMIKEPKPQNTIEDTREENLRKKIWKCHQLLQYFERQLRKLPADESTDSE